VASWAFKLAEVAMKLHLLLVGLLLTLSALAVSAMAAPATYEVTGVAPGDVLNIRLAPRASAPKVGQFGPRDSGIKLYERRGDWALVGRDNPNRPDGWVNARFLKQTVAAARVRLPLACLGTEPFWSLKILSAARAVYDDPETPSRRYRVADFRRSGADATLRLVPGGRVAIAADRCSDGMSDNVYPYAVRLTLPGGRRLSGCCR
jgi:uncharacterized membrane protein